MSLEKAHEKLKKEIAEITRETMSVGEFEHVVNRKEEIRICVRAPTNKIVKTYNFNRKASDKLKLSNFIEKRLKPFLGKLDFIIIDGKNHGSNSIPHPSTTLGVLRKSYE